MKDPNPLVEGRGIKALKKAGIEVEVGLEHKAAAYLNRSYLTWMTQKRPHVVLKMAMTLDGKIATKTGDSKWISNEKSRHILQKIALIEANVLKENPIEVLSPRELEIARFLVSGNGNLEISNQIGIKTSTVSTYKKRILKKLGVKNSHALTLLFGLYDQN